MTSTDHRPLVAAERRERMQNRLISAAFHLAAQGGMKAVTIDAVAVQAQVARGTFYKYFTSTDSLLQVVGRVVSDELIVVMNPIVKKIDDPALRIAVGVRTVLHLVEQHPLVGGFLVRSGWPADNLAALFYTVVGNTLSQGIESERFSKMPKHLALSVVAGTMVGTMHAIVNEGMSGNFIEKTTQVILRALGLSASEAERLSTVDLPLTNSDFAPMFSRLSG